MIWCRQGLGGLPRWSRHYRQKKLGRRLLPPIIVHFVDIVDQRRQPASISSDPCPAGAFERLHHTLIRIFLPDQRLVVVTKLPLLVFPSPAVLPSSLAVVVLEDIVFESGGKVSTIQESRGPSSGKSVWKSRAGSSRVVFPPVSN